MKLAASLTLLIVFFFPNLTSRAWSQRLEAETILSWDFRRQDDTNLDQLPDGWKRRRDREHPAFVKMQITAKDPERDRASKSAQHLMSQVWHALKTGNWNPSYIPEVTPPEIAEFMDKFVLDNCLEVVMQGGNAEYVSPIFPMESRFAYRLRGLVDTTKLYGHTAWIELHLLDSDEQTLRVLPTAASTGDSAWHRVETELASEQDERLAWGRVHIKVDKSDATYFEGAARFDALAVMRQPRLRLTTPLPYQIASPGQPVVVTCRALGIRQLGSSVEFLLQDCMGETMRSEKIVLQRAAPGEMPDRSSPADAHFVAKHSNVGTEELFDGEAVWKLQFDTPGLYRVSVNLGRDAGKSTRRELLIAVMSAAEPFNAGPFGWSWPDLDSDARFQALPELVRHFGAGWIKIPVWFDSTDTNAADRLVELADRLQVEGVKCVGRIENPPKRLRDMLFDNDDQAYSVSVFRDPAAWEPVLEPVLTRMGLKIAWFQLGTDDDFSFMGVPDPANMLADIQSRLLVFSQDLKLSLGWKWMSETPQALTKPWKSVHYRTSPQLTPDELESYISSKALSDDTTWVSIDPLPKSKYSLLDRVRDLCKRMVVIKKHDVEAAFVSKPFDEDEGIFSAQMTAGEMSIPWHTLVSSIGDGEFLGAIELPNGSENYIFGQGELGTMILWNDVSPSEQLYLGEDISATDIWGRKVPVEEARGEHGGPEQRLPVGAWPLFVRGIDIEVVRWRQQFQLGVTNLASTIGGQQEIPLNIVNTFSQAVTGNLVLHCDTLLNDGQAALPLQLPSARAHQRRLPVTIRTDASAGKHALRFDVDFVAGKQYRFSVYRTITLGLGEIEFLWTPHRIDDDHVEMRVELVNHLDVPVDFDCKLFPAGQSYQRIQILNALPGNTTRHVTLPLKESADGGIWIRCEQVGTGRILNYRVKS